MYDLLVVGGGYWGVATALVAEERGKRVLLIDGAHSWGGSRAAAGFFSFGWFKKEPWKSRAVAAFADAQRFGVQFEHTGVMVCRWHDRSHLLTHTDMWTFEPKQFLGLSPPVQLLTFTLPLLKKVAATEVVVCAGINTDDVLRTLGLPPLDILPLRGTGVIMTPGEWGPFRTPLQHQINPYNQISIRKWGEHIRVGETLEKRAALTEEYVKKMLGRMEPYLAGCKVVETISGYRPMLASGPTVKRVAPGVIVASGGGRSGGVLAFWAAQEVLALCT